MMSERPRNHAAGVAKLEACVRERFPFFRTLLLEGRNLIFFGFGSKRSLAAVRVRPRVVRHN